MQIEDYNLPKESFIGGWIISDEICDGLLSYYKEHSAHVLPGLVSENKLNKKIKESQDLYIAPDNFDKEILEYRIALQKTLEKYIEKYPDVDKYSKFNVESFNIQKYPSKGGFKVWHFESGSKQKSDRILVFMTYLITLENAGTEFKYQNMKIPCKKGLTVIWPSDFTHTHRGIITDKEKIIATGWFTLL